MSRKRSHQQIQDDKRLYKEGLVLYKNIPAPSRNSFETMVNWFNEKLNKCILDIGAFDSLMSSLIGDHKIPFDVNDLKECVHGAKNLPFVQTFYTILAHDKRSPHPMNILEIESYTINGDSVVHDIVEGYYHAPSENVRKSYVNMMEAIMKHGVDLAFRPYMSQKQRTETSQSTYRVRHIPTSPIFILCIEKYYDFIHDLALRLNTDDLSKIDVDLAFIIANFDKATIGMQRYYNVMRITAKEIKTRLTHGYELIGKELRRRVVRSRKSIRIDTKQASLFVSKPKVSYVKQQQQQQEQTWTFEKYLAGTNTSQAKKKQWELLHQVPPILRTSFSHFFSCLHQLREYMIIDAHLLDDLLTHMLVSGLFENKTITHDDIIECIYGIVYNPLVKTIRTILDNLTPQLFFTVSNAGKDYEEFTSLNYTGKCMEGYMKTGLATSRRQYLDLLVLFVRKGICRLAFPFAVISKSTDIVAKKIEFIIASFLFRIAIWQYWDFIADLANHLDKERVVESMNDIDFMIDHIHILTNEVQQFLHDNQLTIDIVQFRLRQARRIFKKSLQGENLNVRSHCLVQQQKQQKQQKQN